ncbi:MAG: glycosyltransferase [Candidatus Korobacteraceae bacterium]
MKTVVIVGADFVPSSLPPALRIRFFTRHLPEFGWKPVVLTTDPRYYESSIDPENQRLLPENLEVIRTPALEASWTRKFGLGDLGIRSLWHHWQGLQKVCSERKVDLVFVPVPPSVPMVLGRLAWNRFRIPYVVDYIDPWVTRYYFTVPRNQRPPKWWMAHYMAVALEPFAMRHVGHITGVSQGTTDSVVNRYDWLTREDSTEIPYGGEPADFDYLRRNPRKNLIFQKQDGLFHLSYVGAVIPAMHGPLRALLRAIREGLNGSLELFGRLRVHFAGTTYARAGAVTHQVLPIAKEMGVEAVVSESPARVAYLDALQILLDSDATVVLGSDQPHYTASKLYPYILAGRPMLAIFHEQSNAIDVLRQTRAGHVVPFGSGEAAEAKSELVKGWLAGVLSGTRELCFPATDWKAFETYTTRAMAARLASAFAKGMSKNGAGARAAAN